MLTSDAHEQMPVLIQTAMGGKSTAMRARKRSGPVRHMVREGAKGEVRERRGEMRERRGEMLKGGRKRHECGTRLQTAGMAIGKCAVHRNRIVRRIVLNLETDDACDGRVGEDVEVEVEEDAACRARALDTIPIYTIPNTCCGPRAPRSYSTDF